MSNTRQLKEMLVINGAVEIEKFLAVHKDTLIERQYRIDIVLHVQDTVITNLRLLMLYEAIGIAILKDNLINKLELGLPSIKHLAVFVDTAEELEQLKEY